jgi:hypothetical protein
VEHAATANEDNDRHVTQVLDQRGDARVYSALGGLARHRVGGNVPKPAGMWPCRRCPGPSRPVAAGAPQAAGVEVVLIHR